MNTTANRYTYRVDRKKDFVLESTILTATVIDSETLEEELLIVIAEDVDVDPLTSLTNLVKLEDACSDHRIMIEREIKDKKNKEIKMKLREMDEVGDGWNVQV